MYRSRVAVICLFWPSAYQGDVWMYEGRSTRFLNRIFKGRARHSLEDYFKEVDKRFFVSNIYFLFCSFSVFLLFSKEQKILLFIKEKLFFRFSIGLKYFKQFFMKNKKIVLLSLILFILFYSLYSAIGFSLAETSAFEEHDILFDADTPRVIEDIAIFSARHHRTKVHPIYVLLVNPIGSLLRNLVHSKTAVAVIINSFFGAFGVVLAFFFFWLFSKNYINSLLLSAVFGLSMSQLFFSTVPETFSLAVCSLLITYILFLVCLRKRQLYFELWVLSGIFTLGVTTTNFIQTLICFSVLMTTISKNERKDFSKGAQISLFVGTVIFLTSLLAIVQKIIYPSSVLFFLPRAYAQDISTVNFLIIQHPLRAISQIIKHFFLVNFIAPLPNFFFVPHRVNLIVRFSSSMNYVFIGWIGTVLWLCLLLTGVLKMFFLKRKIFPFFIGIFLCIVFNIVLHSFYGINGLFLYTGNFTFLALLFLCNYLISEKVFSKILLALLLLLMGFNNLLVMKEILTIYK